MSTLSLAEQKEIRELIGWLIDLEKPDASDAEREQMRCDWMARGYEEIVRAWTYCHRKLREEHAA